MVTDAKPRKPSAAPNTKAGLLRVELAIEGVHSLLSGRFLALAQSLGRCEQSLDELTKLATLSLAAQQRMADALEHQNRLLAQRTNGHAEQPSSTV